MKKTQLKEIIREIIHEELALESKASEEAKRIGLKYMSFGRWGKGGKITHRTQGGKLVPVRDASGKLDRKMASSMSAPKSPEWQRRKNMPQSDLAPRVDVGGNEIERTPLERHSDVISKRVFDKGKFEVGQEVPKEEFLRRTGLTQQVIDKWTSFEQKNLGQWEPPIFSDNGDTVYIHDPMEL